MPVDVVVPQLGESVSEGEISAWLKDDGDVVATDEILLELETDKTTVEIPAPASGVLRILKEQGSVVAVGDVLARVEEGAQPSSRADKPKAKAATPPVEEEAAEPPTASAAAATANPPTSGSSAARVGPAARRLAEERGLDPSALRGSGPGGRVTKRDVEAAAEGPRESEAAAEAPHEEAPALARPAAESDGEERVRMSRLRRTIADRLVAAQHTAAILTTFNEIDMSGAMELRARHKESFQAAHGVSLGYMSIFARACVLALRDLPIVGARIEGDEIVYSSRVHLGIAASTDKGLVVPVVRNADLLGLAGLEREIARLAGLARDGKLGVDDLAGGTFTISNGGVFGSLLSTPILNPPQSGILGMHKIEKRAVVVGDEIAIRPMMYVALSYDHRIIDGRDAVTFLVRVKERIEDPSRMFLEI